nr:gamma-glutamyl-gamma-aminobutyrate hydrolase family protein [uncultured Sunxiuqinia sp.]
MRMRKTTLFFLVVACFFTNFPTVAQDYFKDGGEAGKTYILMAHPTVQNIERMKYLIDNHFLFIGESEIVGIYYSFENYNYNQSINYIRDNELSKFHLQHLTGLLTPENIYTENDFTHNFEVLFDQTLGIFFFGGPDIQPITYDEENRYAVVTDPYRHLFELSLAFHLLGGSQSPDYVPLLEKNPKYFICGFCLGMQTMNVATGGKMVQDIPAEIYGTDDPSEIVEFDRDKIHRNYWQEIFTNDKLMNVNFHQLRLPEGGFFAEDVKWKKEVSPPVLSAHHQAIKDPNKCWEITAWSMDKKVIEGIHHKKYPNVFGVQFHPEIPELYYPADSLIFSPSDQPKSYFDRIGSDGQKFHKKLWRFVSKSIQ